MALIKLEEGYGFPINYWRIVDIYIDREKETGHIGIKLFYSKESTKAVEYKYINIKNETFDDFFNSISEHRDLYNACYEYIKNYYPELDMVDDEEEVALKASRH